MNYEKILSQMSSPLIDDPQEKEDAHERARMASLFNGLSDASDSIYTAYTGKAAQKSSRSDPNQAIKNYLAEKENKQSAKRNQLMDYLRVKGMQSDDLNRKAQFDSNEKKATSDALSKEEDRNYRRERDKSQDEFNEKKLNLEREKLLASKAAKENQKTKLTPAQEKQAGLARIGEEAENQWQAAVKGGAESKEWVPTAYSDSIDNSNWAPNWMKNDNAIAGKNAAANWIENYLRDASGAAIPDAERDAYFAIYFPQPGDDAQTVTNKKALRYQKMNNARIAAGMQPMDGDTAVAVERDSGKILSGTANANSGSGERFFKVRNPKGIVVSIPESKLKQALDNGGERVD